MSFSTERYSEARYTKSPSIRLCMSTLQPHLEDRE